MTAATHRLFDATTLRRRRQRARHGTIADFLLVYAAKEFADRLSLILRPFISVAEVGSLGTQLQRALSRDNLVRIGPMEANPDIIAHDDLLPLRSESTDLILSSLTFQFVDDLPGLLVQIRKALRADGLMLAAMLGGHTLNELRIAFAQAEGEIVGGISPRVIPFVDVRDAGGLLQRAGFALPVADSDTLTVRYDNVFALMADLRAMAGTNILIERIRRPTRRSVMVRMAEIYAERFSDPDGRIRATFEIIWMSGWAPHESQQKPLRPGSAKARLADALGTSERKIGGRTNY